MKEIKPTYVTFEQSRWLQDKNFKVWCKFRYTDFNGNIQLEENASEIFPFVPEQWQVVEWLRLNHGIWVTAEMIPFEKGRFFEYSICDFDNCLKQNGVYESPQEAYSAAFDYINENNLI